MNLGKIRYLSGNYFNSYIAKALSFYTIANLITAVVGFITMGWYTKYLGPDEFGKATMLWIVITTVSIFVDCRLNTAFSIKYYKNTKEQNTTNLYSILIFNLIISTFIFISLLIIPNLLTRMVGTGVNFKEIVLVYLILVTMTIGQFYLNILMISQEPKKFFIVKIIYNITYLVISVLYLIVFKKGYITYLLSYLVAYCIITIMGILYFNKNYKPIKNKIISLKALKNLLKIGIPLIPNALLLMLLTWQDRYVLNIYSGLIIVGIYTVGYRFGELLNNFLFVPFGQSISPLLFKESSESLDRYRKTMAMILNHYWIISIGLLIGYFTILREAFNLFIGLQYFEGYNIISIVCIGIVFLGISGIIGSTIVIKEKTDKIFLITLVSVIINTILNFMLIPKYGMYGAAYATTISYALNFVMTFIYSQRLIYVQYNYKFIFKTTVISILLFFIQIVISKVEANTFVLLGIKLIILIIYAVYAFFMIISENKKGDILHGNK